MSELQHQRIVELCQELRLSAVPNLYSGIAQSAATIDALSGGRGNSNLQASVAQGIQSAGENGGAAGLVGVGMATGMFGAGAMRKLFCERMYCGRWACTMCLTEPQAGSDVGAAKARAVKQPNGRYLIQGEKIFITSGEQDVTENIIQDFRAKSGVNAREVTDEEILERCIYPMINEGAKILEEGKAIRASDIDIVWINGYGWPVYRGGPMYYGDTVGLDRVLAKMREWHTAEGEDFKTAALLEKLVAEGKNFRDLK